jgi:hypothetical protein
LADFVAEVGDRNVEAASSIRRSGDLSAALHGAVWHCLVDGDVGIA